MASYSKIEEALQIIHQAVDQRSESLNIAGLSLDEIPFEVGKMNWLRRLDISYNPIKDISVVSGLSELTSFIAADARIEDISPLTNLQKLVEIDLAYNPISSIEALRGKRLIKWVNLKSTGVADLRPLRDIVIRKDEQLPQFVQFEQAAAFEFDPAIEFVFSSGGNESHSEAAQLIHYLQKIDDAEYDLRLKHWRDNPRSDWLQSTNILQDSIAAPAYVVPDNGPARSVELPFAAADADQEDLRRDLVAKAQLLREKVGGSNELAPFAHTTAHYQARIDRPLQDIRPKLLWSAANALRQWREAHQGAVRDGRINAQLPPEVAAVLEDLTATQGLFWMGFPEGPEIERLIREGLGQQPDPALPGAAAVIVGALEGKDRVLDPADQAAMADDAAAASGEGPSAELARVSVVARVRNMLGAMVRWAWKRSKAGAGVAATTVATNDIIRWLDGNQTYIMQFYTYLGGHAPTWWPMIVQAIKIALKLQ